MIVNKRKIIFLIGSFMFMALLLKACVRADIPDKNIKNLTESASSYKEPEYPGIFKTVLINRVECKQARGEVGKFGGTFYSSTTGEGPKTFNPWEAKDATSSNLGELMFDGLVTTDAYTGQVIPQLAKSINVNKSGTEYTIVLRKGLKWSDSKPITSDDVVFTWNDIIGAGLGNTSMRDNLLIDNKMPQIIKVDDLTVKFITPQAFAPFLRQLSVPIAPKHILAPVVKNGIKTFSAFWGVNTPPEKFVTSGMFHLERYIPAQRVELKRNPNYYAVDKKMRKLPYFDKYVTYIVGDQNSEVLKFEAGELDTIAVNGKNAARFKALEPGSNYKIYNLGPDTGTTFLVLNMNDRKNASDKKFYVDPIKQKWFNDINFRKALDYAIDRESIVANVLNGVGTPLYTAESPSSIYINKKLRDGHPRNISIAKNLLKKSGFYWDKIGKLHDKSGNIVEYNLLTNAGNNERESTGVMIKQDLEELGMKVNFKPIEFNVLVGKLVDSFDWDAVILGLTGSPLDPHSGKNVWYSSGSLHLFNQRSFVRDLKSSDNVRDWEAQLNNIFDKASKTLDESKRKAYYNEYQDIIYKQAPLLYIYSPLKIYAVRKKIGNLKPTKLGGITHNLEELYIK